MSCRRHGGKPKIALWMLVAVADLAILATTAAGALVLVSVLATLAVAAGGVVAARLITRRTEPANAAVRRRA